jgi:hypothetical protein
LKKKPKVKNLFFTFGFFMPQNRYSGKKSHKLWNYSRIVPFSEMTASIKGFFKEKLRRFAPQKQCISSDFLV